MSNNTVPLQTAAIGRFDIWREIGKQPQFLTTDVDGNVSYPKEFYPKRDGVRVRNIDIIVGQAAVTLTPADMATGLLVFNIAAGHAGGVIALNLPTENAFLAYISGQLNLPAEQFVIYPDNPSIAHTALEKFYYCFKIQVNYTGVNSVVLQMNTATWDFMQNGLPATAAQTFLSVGSYGACITADASSQLTMELSSGSGLSNPALMPRFPVELIDPNSDFYITWNDSDSQWEVQLWQELVSGERTNANQNIKLNPDTFQQGNRTFAYQFGVFVGWGAGPTNPAGSPNFLTCIGANTGHSITTEHGVTCLGVTFVGGSAGSSGGIVDDSLFFAPGLVDVTVPAGNTLTYDNGTGRVIFTASATQYKQDLKDRVLSADQISKIDQLNLKDWIWRKPVPDASQKGKVKWNIGGPDLGLAAQQIDEVLGSDFVMKGDIKCGDILLEANAAQNFKIPAMIGYLIEVIKDLRSRVASLESH